ncbi:MAG: hypothetical protein IJ859_05150 [Synergistaceae bacterium]|nr:hypothetical protein [Synergistaceae bacterium]
MRFIGSLIKYFIYLCLVLIAVGAALFWFDTGSWLVKPLAIRAGNFFLDPLKLEIENINGSVHNGFSVEKLKLISGDEDLFTLNYASVSPDWDLILKSLTDDNILNGVPFIKNLNVSGVSSDLENVMALVDHFDESEDKKEEKEPVKFTLNPFNLEIKDVNFGTPYSNLELDALTLNEAGNLLLDSKIISGENIFPVKTNAVLNFNPIEIISSDLFLGQATGNLAANIEPLKANLKLKSLSLDELLKFVPKELQGDIKVSGLIDADVKAEQNGDFIKAAGFLAMPQANIMDVPLSFNLPFSWDGEKVLNLLDATLKTQAAKLNLSASADIASMKILANGQARNISLTEIGTMFAPELKLKGEGGNIDFDIDTVASGDILSNTRADIKADMPSISAMGIKILENLAAKIKLDKQQAPKLDVTGRIFGGKLFARGEVTQDFKPQAIVSLVNVDVPTLINIVPEAAKSVKNPSGKITLRTIIHENLNLDTTLTSEKLAANGIALTNIKANANYSVNENLANLESFSANLGGSPAGSKGLITASGKVNLNTGDFNSALKTENLDPRIVPELKKLNLLGIYNLSANASGNYNKIESIKADAVLNAKGVGYDKLKIGNIDFPVSYANNLLNIKNAKANIPGGALNLAGNVNLKNTANPAFDLALSTRGINLAETLKAFNLQDKNMPVSGKVSGAADIEGNLKNLILNATIRAENVKAGNLLDMPQALIDVKGDMKKISLNKLETKINGSDIKGLGSLNINQKNFMNSTVSFSANLKHLNIKKILAQAMGSSPVDGVIDATASVKGTIAKPEGELKITRPIFYGNNEIRDIAVKLNSPEANHYKINAGARIEKFKPEVDIDVKQKDGIFTYRVDTKPLDINSAIETQIPSMSGMAKGFANVSVTGSTKPNTNININATAKEIKLMDKISIKNISLPIVFLQDKNKIEMKNGNAYLSDGIIKTGLDVDLTKKNYTSKVKISDLDFGKLAGKFLPEGELIGKANAEANIKGNFGVMPTSYANGKFSTTPGYIHKMSIIDKVTPTKKISFENISGSFFWNGKDLFLNPGTGATADKNEPLYRYVHINGSLGIPGKGLNLLFDGRFDLKILDQLLGAMKGVFQYMTGNLAQNVLRDAAGRIFGVKRRDFQTVSFRLANSWNELRLLDLKITKPIEDFLPIDMLNKDQEQQKDDTQFKLNLKIPVGKGDESIEEESTSDQFKQQLIDNLFNIGF